MGRAIPCVLIHIWDDGAMDITDDDMNKGQAMVERRRCYNSSGVKRFVIAKADIVRGLEAIGKLKHITWPGDKQ